MARLSTVHSTSISGVNNSANLGDPVPLTSARYGEFSPKKSGKSSQNETGVIQSSADRTNT